jgi:O-acetyl-ADP-ribose deacetylase (regulator of RNase III)
LNTIKGDLLTLAAAGTFDVIVHGCNCFNNMGAGIAVGVARNYPAAHIADMNTVKGDKDKLGSYSQARVLTRTNPVNTFTIINAYTQYGYNASLNVDLFEYEDFQQILNKLAEDFPNSSFGFPLIGCGLAGGDKRRILDMIENFSKMIEAEVTVVEWDK